MTHPRCTLIYLSAKTLLITVFALLMTSLLFLSMQDAHAQLIRSGPDRPLPKFACEVRPDFYVVATYADTWAWVYSQEHGGWGPYRYSGKDKRVEWNWRNPGGILTATLEKCESNEWGEASRACSTSLVSPTIDYFNGESHSLSSNTSATGINSPSMSQMLNSSYEYIRDPDGHRVKGTVDEQIKFTMGACGISADDCKYYGRADTSGSGYWIDYTSAVTSELKVNYELNGPFAALTYYQDHTSRPNFAHWNGIEESNVTITMSDKGSLNIPVVPGSGYIYITSFQAQLAGKPNRSVNFNSHVTWELPCKHPGNFHVSASASQHVIATLDGRYLLPVTVRAYHDNVIPSQSVAIAGENQVETEWLCGFAGSAANFYEIFGLQVALQAEYKVGGETVRLNGQTATLTPFIIGCSRPARFLLDITEYVKAGGAANSPLTLKAYVDPDPYWYYDSDASPIANNGEYKETDEEDNVDVDVLHSILFVNSGPATVDAPTTSPRRAVVSVGLTSGIADVELEGVHRGGTLNVTSQTVAPPSPPASFTLLDTYYEVEASNVQFERANIRLPYLMEEVEKAGLLEGSLRLLHLENGQWKDVTAGIDVENKVISGTVDSFSPFAIGVLNLQECAFTIENDAAFTGKREVQLFSYVTNAMQIMVSNDADFTGAISQTYSPATPWTMAVTGDQVVSQTIYARVKDVEGSGLCGDVALTDTITYDPLPPTVEVTTTTAGSAADMPNTVDATITLNVSAVDQADGSGVTEMQVSDDANFVGASWQPFASTVAVEANPTRTVHVRVRDGVGNISNSASVQIIGEPDIEPSEDNLFYLPLIRP